MPGPMLHLGATVTCTHGGQAIPLAPNPRVLLSGQPAVAQSSPWQITGCGFVPSGGNGPCVTGTYIAAATRVLIAGQPAVLLDSMSTCVPTGTPLIPVQSQTRVIGS